MGNALITRRGGGKPEGMYVWKKSSVVLLDSITTKVRENYELGTATFDTTVYYSTSYTFDEATGIYTLVNPQSANLAYNGSGGVATVSMEKSTYYIWDSTSSDKIYTTNDGSTYNVGIRNVGGSVFLESTVTNEKYDIHSAKAEHIFLDYIVSDKETAYPDGGEKGGYWYEKVSEAKVASGSITLSSTASNLVIEHGLGKAPTRFAVILSSGSEIYKAGTISALYDGTNCYLNWYGQVLSSYEVLGEKGTPTISDTNISIPEYSSNWVIATYQWIAVAE